AAESTAISVKAATTKAILRVMSNIPHVELSQDALCSCDCIASGADAPLFDVEEYTRILGRICFWSSPQAEEACPRIVLCLRRSEFAPPGVGNPCLMATLRVAPCPLKGLKGRASGGLAR